MNKYLELVVLLVEDGGLVEEGDIFPIWIPADFGRGGVSMVAIKNAEMATYDGPGLCRSTC